MNHRFSATSDPERIFYGILKGPRSVTTGEPVSRECRSHRSRLGPVCNTSEEAFQPATAGMFLCSNDQASSPFDCCPLSSSTLRLYYQNVRGLRTKIEELFLAVSDSEYDVIVLTETWLNDEITSVQLFGHQYNVYRRDRDPVSTGLRRGGGVLVAVSNRLTSSPLTDLTGIDQSIEHLWVTIETGEQKMYIGVVYISPNDAVNPSIFDAHLNSAAAVADCLRPNDRHILLGDYNQPLLNWLNTSANFAYPDPATSAFSTCSSALLDAMELLGNRQMNLVTNSRGRTLDLVFVNELDGDSCIVSTPMEPLIEVDHHHPPLLVTLTYPGFTPFESTTDTCSLNFHKADFTQISEILLHTNWSYIENATDVDLAVDFFTTTLHESFGEHVPMKRPVRKPPWSDSHLRMLKRIRAAAIRRLSRAFMVDKRRFNIASSNYKRYNRFRYAQHVERMQNTLKHNPKRFWSFVNEKRKETGFPSEMYLGEHKSSNLEQTCNLFAEHFASVFSTSHASSPAIVEALQNVPSTAGKNVIVFGVNEPALLLAVDRLRCYRWRVNCGI
ncbi:uncharacterized protein LOC129741815 [Uranotaenia lowii]|uniref:uncharacterized protein LOC129741815 n=1 Tax=Uranotaenia lowii TaxID=190385 RepID=UPI00247AFC8F|nr:uncharacterized protein LOC129741815 [Uranotaenia lowii]